MAIMAIYRSTEVDRAKYDQIVERVGSTGEPPEGAMLHFAGFGDGGIAVIEVWDSRETLQEFLEGRVFPALREAGLPQDPPEVLEVHRGIATDAIDGFKEPEMTRTSAAGEYRPAAPPQ